MQYWKPGDIYNVACPRCGQSVEFFKDETARRCGACGHRFVNPSLDFGCAAYCPFAEQCIGTLPEEAVAVRENLLKDRVAVAMKRHYRSDFQRIGRAARRARLAERLGRESQAPLAVLLIAAYLRDMPAEDARQLLAGLGARQELTEQVLALLSPVADSAAAGLTLVADLLQDTEWLLGWEARAKTASSDPATFEQQLQVELRTAAGRQEARALLAQ
jgi:hypothetical protein